MSHPLAHLGAEPRPSRTRPTTPTFPRTFEGVSGHFTVECESNDFTGLPSEPIVVFHHTADSAILGGVFAPVGRARILGPAKLRALLVSDPEVRAEVRRLSR